MVVILADHDKQRPSPPTKNLTAPIIMNGYSIDDSIAPVREKYEHGIQIIDGDKQFKYGIQILHKGIHTNPIIARNLIRICNLPKLHTLDLIII